MSEPSRPTYEGRPLPRPDEELVDQGLAFDLQTLLGRRNLLKAFGAGGALFGLAACAGSTGGSATSSASASATASTGSSASANAGTATTEIPDETAGPYPGDGSNGPDVLEQSGVVRSDITSSFGSSTTKAEGVPTTIELTVQNLTSGAAMAGAAVYVWHCNRDGEYSMYGQGITNENYLRGVQIADDKGVVKFTSIFPACYSGRWPHIHFEVYPDEASITDSSKAIATSQLAIPQQICDTVYATDGYSASVRNLSQLSLASDNVFGDDSAARQLAAVSGDVASGIALSLPVGIDTTTTPTGGAAPGGGGMGGAPPSGGMGGPPTDN